MESWGTPVLAGYPCKDFQSRTNCSHLLLSKHKIRPNTPPETQDFSLWRRPAGQTLSKALDTSSATARVAPDLLTSPAILLDTFARLSAVDREDLKPHWKSDKRPHFLRWSSNLLFTSFSRTLLSIKKKKL